MPTTMRSTLSRALGLVLVASLLLAVLAAASPTPASALPSQPSDEVDSLRKHKHKHGHHHLDQERDEWSSIMGWVSIACWVIVYTPQMHQNFVSKSAEGLSITFIVIWLAGDALNAAGAYYQGLLWTMIFLALYYCACDGVLIFQYWYYGKYYQGGVKISTISASLDANEHTPLLGDGSVIEDDMSSKGEDEDVSLRSQLLMYTLASLLVVATGLAAWWVAKHNGAQDQPGRGRQEPIGWRWDAQAYGWLSAALYLSSRVPQILKNRTTKCEGLSLALFVFAVAGNLTYVASILLKSSDREYILQSISWLVGSLGTVVLDFIVLGQFIHYRKARKEIHRLRRASFVQRAAQHEH